MEIERVAFDWSVVDKAIGEKFPLCLKKILSTSGYDSLPSIQELCENKLNEIEKYISDFGSSVINELNCCHSQEYKNQTQFRLLPGHRTLLSILPRKINEMHEQIANEKTLLSQDIPVILSELVKTEKKNSKKGKNHAEYSDILRYFSTYIYLMSGKCCYETLNANLPIPSNKTIRKYTSIADRQHI